MLASQLLLSLELLSVDPYPRCCREAPGIAVRDFDGTGRSDMTELRELCTAIPNPVFVAIEIADIRFS
jgi:hypothetical protein